MPIKTEVSLKPGTLDFPKIMRASNTGCIVFFSGPQKGVCLHAGSTINIEGELGDTWVMDDFEDFRGTVTLTQD